MEISISDQTMRIICNSLRTTAHDPKTRIRKAKTSRELAILNAQLETVEGALLTFTEILEVTL